MEYFKQAISEAMVPISALLASAVLFGIFIAFAGASPFETYALMYKGAFGSWFSWQNTLQRAAPLLLTALCTALPAQMGLVIIGGEGALVVGGLVSVMTVLALRDFLPILAVQIAMLSGGFVAGGLWVAGIGALRHKRGVNEIISSLPAPETVETQGDRATRDPTLFEDATYEILEALAKDELEDEVGGIAARHTDTKLQTKGVGA